MVQDQAPALIPQSVHPARFRFPVPFHAVQNRIAVSRERLFTNVHSFRVLPGELNWTPHERVHQGLTVGEKSGHVACRETVASLESFGS